MLTLTGAGTRDEYEAALLQVRYSNPSDNPATHDRLIEVVVSDGVNTSNVAAAVITVVAVNDPPVLTVDPSAAYVENAAARCALPARRAHRPRQCRAQPGDRDHHRRPEYRRRLTIGGVTGGNVNGILFIYDVAAHAMVMTGASSLLNYQNLLQTLGFHSNSDNPTDFGASDDADPDVDRIGWRGRHDRDDDARYRRRERCPAGDGRRNRVLYGERGAGRALAGVNRNRRRRHLSRCG